MASAESVRAAADMLDELHPGWYRWIDTDTLDLFDSRVCIGGQIATHEGIVRDPLDRYAPHYWDVLNVKLRERIGRDEGAGTFASSHLEEFWVEQIELRLDFDRAVAEFRWSPKAQASS